MNTTSAARTYDQRLAAPMFVLAVIHLLFVAAMLHLHQDNGFHPWGRAAFWGTFLVYPAFLCEFYLRRRHRCTCWKRDLTYVLLPPLRVAARDAATGEQIWLPFLGWKKIDDALRVRLERAFSVPMIVIALLVLPLMALEHFAAERISESEGLQLAVQSATSLIWFAFTLEFIVMISVVEKKWKYAKEHWIDILVILLPLVAFLRAARLGRLVRLQQLTRTARVYRVRGLLLRTYRALLLLEVVDRLLRRTPEKKLAQLRQLVELKQAEVDELRQELEQLEVRVELERQTIEQVA